jgi:hypothetical protein
MDSSVISTASTEVPSVDLTTTLSTASTATHHHRSYESSYYYPHEGNSTLSTSVTIHVTPEHYYLMSWLVLWILFVATIAFGAYQSHKEHQWLTAAQKTTNEDLEQGGTGASTSIGGGLSSASTRHGKIVIVGGTRVSTIGTAAAGGNVSDGEAVSSGDMSRTMVRFSNEDFLSNRWCYSCSDFYILVLIPVSALVVAGYNCQNHRNTRSNLQ